MKLNLLVGTLLVILLLAAIVIAQVTSDTDTATVAVVVANLTLIDISPNEVTFSGINPGAVSSAATNFDLENIGSKPINYITADIIGLPTSNPFETGAAANYYAGNYLALALDYAGVNVDPTVTDVNDFNFTRTRNFNESADNPRYLVQKDASTLFEGRFRFDNEEFFFEVVPSAGYYGNGTLYFSTAAHNDTALGDVDLSDNTGVSLTFYTDAATTPHVGYATINIPLDVGSRTYCAIVNATAAGPGSYIDLTYHSDEARTKCGLPGILPADGDLQPGMSRGLNLGVRIAYGVMQGSLTSSTLQITATSSY